MSRPDPASASAPETFQKAEGLSSGFRRLAVSAAAALGAVALIFAAFALWLDRRAGEDFYGRPEALLPPDAGALATWTDFSGFMEDAERLQAFQKLREERDVFSLLFSGPLEVLTENRDEARYRMLRAKARDFVETWLGREFSVALTPASSGAEERSPSAGILIIARTNVGFEENFAEFVAQNAPRVRIETEEYRGVALHRLTGESERKSFGYCRFGKTVVLSLRSGAWERLREVVDRRLNETSPKLAGSAPFKAWNEWAKPLRDRAFTLYVQPQTLLENLRTLPASVVERDSWRFWFEYAEAKLVGCDWGGAALRIEDGLRLSSFWSAPGEIEPAAPLPVQPASSLAAVAASHPRLGDFLRDLRVRALASRAYEDRLRRFEAKWEERTGLRFDEDFLAPLDDAAFAALTDLRAGLLAPLPEACAGMRLRDADAARNLKHRVAEHFGGPSIPLSLLLGSAVVDDQDAWAGGGWNRAPLFPDDASKHAEIPEAFLDAVDPPGADTALLATLDFERAHKHLATLERTANIWPGKTRDRFSRAVVWLSALRHCRKATLWAGRTPQGTVIEASLAVE